MFVEIFFFIIFTYEIKEPALHKNFSFIVVSTHQVAGGIAEKDGQLRKGDQILSVNEFDMRQVSQEAAVNVLKVSSVYALCSTLQ